MAGVRMTKPEVLAVAGLALFAYWIWPISAGKPVELRALDGRTGVGCGQPSQHSSSVSKRYSFPDGVPAEVVAKVEREALDLGFRPDGSSHWIRPQGFGLVTGRQWISVLRNGIVVGSYYKKSPFGS